MAVLGLRQAVHGRTRPQTGRTWPIHGRTCPYMAHPWPYMASRGLEASLTSLPYLLRYAHDGGEVGEVYPGYNMGQIWSNMVKYALKWPNEASWVPLRAPPGTPPGSLLVHLLVHLLEASWYPTCYSVSTVGRPWPYMAVHGRTRPQTGRTWPY